MKVTVSRKSHFNAAHRLHNPAWTSEENHLFYGKCNNPNYHGHNYEVIVKVTGEVNPETGFVVDMKWLKEVVESEVCEYLDHKNLNIEIEEFRKTNPTAENIAIVIWNRLRKHIERTLELKVVLFETERNFVEYEGH